jgi:hypothetical protein
VPTNRFYISLNAVFDENNFSFSAMPHTPTTDISMHSSPFSLGQFEDVAYSPLLLPNHGAGTGCGAHLEELPDAASAHAGPHVVGSDVDHAACNAPAPPPAPT